jgi:hypothetical protein
LGTAAAFAFPPLDLTAGGTTVQSSVDGTVWRNTDLLQSAGTGVYDPFLRVQANGTEDGMNTDGDRVYDQVGGGDDHTHSLLFGDLHVTTIDLGQGAGVQSYYIFTLDFNEPSGNGADYLSLDALRIYSANNSAGALLETEADVLAASGGTLHYDLDGTSDQTVYLNYAVSNKGSGEDDIDLFIPTSFFAGATDDDYLYFYSAFGNVGTVGSDPGDPNFDSADGFEEWAADIGENGGSGGAGGAGGAGGEAPEPGTLALLGVGLAGLAARRRS